MFTLYFLCLFPLIGLAVLSSLSLLLFPSVLFKLFELLSLCVRLGFALMEPPRFLALWCRYDSPSRVSMVATSSASRIVLMVSAAVVSSLFFYLVLVIVGGGVVSGFFGLAQTGVTLCCDFKGTFDRRLYLSSVSRRSFSSSSLAFAPAKSVVPSWVPSRFATHLAIARASPDYGFRRASSRAACRPRPRPRCRRVLRHRPRPFPRQRGQRHAFNHPDRRFQGWCGVFHLTRRADASRARRVEAALARPHS